MASCRGRQGGREAGSQGGVKRRRRRRRNQPSFVLDLQDTRARQKTKKKKGGKECVVIMNHIAWRGTRGGLALRRANSKYLCELQVFLSAEK